jgi:hypothetical protein
MKMKHRQSLSFEASGKVLSAKLPKQSEVETANHVEQVSIEVPRFVPIIFLVFQHFPNHKQFFITSRAFTSLSRFQNFPPTH